MSSQGAEVVSRGDTLKDTPLDFMGMQRRADTLGGRIEAERKARGWNKSDVARHFGVNQSTASRWESNELRPGEEAAYEMAAWLSISLEEVNGLRFDITPPTEALSELSARLDRLELGLGKRLGAIEDKLLKLDKVLDETLPAVPPEFRSEAPEPKKPRRPRDVPPST
jgi:transcriptional regulator with XRE-family HTH domain